MGCVIADMRQDFVQTINTLVSGLDEAALGALSCRTHANQGMVLLDAACTTFEAREVTL